MLVGCIGFNATLTAKVISWQSVTTNIVFPGFLTPVLTQLGVFSPLTSAEACGKSSRWLWKEKLCKHWCEKPRKHICVSDRHDMTLAVKVALNPNTTNQVTQLFFPKPPTTFLTCFCGGVRRKYTGKVCLNRG